MQRHFTKLFWPTLSGTFACMLLAGVLFGFDFMNAGRPPFYFMLLGFAGSLSLALLRLGRARDVVFINILIYLVFIVLTHALKPPTSLILIIYYTAQIAALFLYVRYYDAKVNNIRFAGPLLILSLSGLFYMAASLVHNLIYITRFSLENLLFNMPIGFLIGLGIAIGSESSRLFPPQS